MYACGSTVYPCLTEQDDRNRSDAAESTSCIRVRNLVPITVFMVLGTALQLLEERLYELEL